MFESSIWPAAFAFAGVTLVSLVLAEFGAYVAARYRERFLKEAGTELDDILIQMPADRMLDISLGAAAAGAVITAVVMASQVENISFGWVALIALAVGGILFPVPRLVIRSMKRRRLQKFNIQLEDALGMMANALKAGFSINQALDEIAAQNIHPLAVEFRLLTQEVQLGVSLEQALDNMNRRLGSDDFELVATAILTARQTGGELTGTLERVAGLIRQRVRIAGKVHALTAMGRLQAIMIGGMPFLLLFGMSYVSPNMMGAFLHSAFGVISIIAVCILVTLGFIVIRKITTIEV
ncbi:MAG: type II secretion system F family protein [Victivallaceae bacterium]|nr:type II secretion system F family protein [Victivallaceae bacterium]